MALQVWLPLTNDLRNQGLAQSASFGTTTAFATNGKLGGKSLYSNAKKTATFTELNNVTNFSFAYWIKIDSSVTIQNYADIIGLQCIVGNTTTIIRDEFTNTAGRHNILMGKDSTVGDNTNTYYNTRAESIGAKDIWTHYVIVKDNTNTYVYTNGILTNTCVNSDFENSPQKLTGLVYLGNTSSTAAQVNDLRIYDHCLTPEEAKRIAQGLILHYPLNRNGAGPTMTETTPYLLRHSPQLDYSYSTEFDSIIGGTVAWNQLVQNGNFADTSNWTSTRGSITASSNILTYTVTEVANNNVGNRADSSNINLTANHIYLASAQIYPPRNTTFRFDLGQTGSVSANANVWNNISVLRKPSSSATSTFRIAFNSSVQGYTVNDTVQIKNCICIDLTQMFGSTIADYIYSLEQTTAGAGVAWLKSHGFLTKDYYAYDSGSLQSVKTSEHRTTGFNQWDEEWEVGSIDQNTGAKISASNQIRSKNYIRVVPATNYCITRPANSVHGIAFYDSSKGFIEYKTLSVSGGSTVIETPSNSMFAMFRTHSAYDTTYNHDICINISDTSKNGQYEQYIAHTYPLDSDLELRGKFKLDANNNLYADGDTYESSGAVTRKYGIVDLGTLNWAYAGGGQGRFESDGLISIVKRPASANTKANIICSEYETITASNLYLGSNGIAINTADGQVWVFANGESDAQTFKTTVSCVYLVYELVTPTTEQADPYANPQIVNPLGTEEYVDTRDVPIPVGHETDYSNGLLAWGTTEYDISGFGNNGTRIGTLDWTSDTPKYCVSTVFNGTDATIQCGEDWRVQTAPEITFSAWVYLDDWAKSVDRKFLSSQESGGIILSILSNNKIRARIHAYTASDLSTSTYIQADGDPVSAGWHMVTGVYTTSDIKLYVDGELSKTTITTTYGLHHNMAAHLYLAAEASGISYAELNDCKLCDCRIYATALSADEVKSLYQNCATIGPDGTIYGKIR